MAEVRIDFLRGAGFFSWLIERFGFGTGGYSHCAGVLSDNRYLDARNDCLEGVLPGVHIRDPKSESAVCRVRATLQVSQEVYAEWEKNLRAKIGTQYGRRDILDFVLGRSGHIAGQWICSALQVNALQHVKLVPYPLPVPAHSVSPDSLLLIVATAGFTIGPELHA